MRFARGATLALAIACALPAAARAQGTLARLQTDVDEIARRARPSVVTVFAQRTITYPHPLPGQAPRRLHTRVGSGVALQESMVLTTASVVLGAEKLMVRTTNGLQVEAQLAGMDPIYNLAVLRVPELKLPPLKFADRPAQVGDWVIALGMSYGAQPTQSVGNIAYLYQEPRTSLLQLTNNVYPGNSGGAALNARGELVGIVQGELGSPDIGNGGPDAERRPGGMSFVIPADQAKPVYESLARAGRVPHGWLGVSTRAASVTAESEPHERVPIGAQVESVVTGGPAARAGLKRGDLIVGFEGDRVEYPEQLARWVTATPPGTAVDMVWVRNDEEQSGRITLATSPSVVPEWAMEAPGAGDSETRVADLQRRIRELHRQLEKLKDKPRR
ncbi:MAG TPA: trypsin-like peptidase domain-containing protein [Candidatus Eisenbacteria bacterium]|nr:trypsin-like peptidase domain-containing protein [Candidatus Eisenbacteria bacterium]